PPHSLPSFPTRRSSDLLLSFGFLVKRFNGVVDRTADTGIVIHSIRQLRHPFVYRRVLQIDVTLGSSSAIQMDMRPALIDMDLDSDRKSTRLNSSHVAIS